MKKRLMALLLALVCVCGVLPMGVSAAEWPFKDVKTTDSYYEAVKYVYENGLFLGTSATEFSPDVTMTRSMFVTVLGRLDGVGTDYATTTKFSDAKKNEWYTAYVAWASDKGIVNGYDTGAFGVNDTINVEQAAAILARYYNFKKLPAAEKADPSKFQDSDKISSWAKNDLLWAVGAGIYNAKGSLKPQADAQRSLVATMVHNLAEIIKKANSTSSENEPPLAPPPSNDGEWDQNVTYVAQSVLYDFNGFANEDTYNADHEWLLMKGGMQYVEGLMQIKDKELRINAYHAYGWGAGFRFWNKKWKDFDYFDINFTLKLDDNQGDQIFRLCAPLQDATEANGEHVNSAGSVVFSLQYDSITNMDGEEIGVIKADGKPHDFKVRLIKGSQTYEVYMDGKLLSKENWHLKEVEMVTGIRVFVQSNEQESYITLDNFVLYRVFKK